MQELYFIFNSDPDNYNKNSLSDFTDECIEEGKNAKCKNGFEIFRRKRMENAIAQMIQMSLHAKKIINPNDNFYEKESFRQGSIPNFNIRQMMEDFKRKLDSN